MHCAQTLSVKAPSRATTAVVATPLFGCRRQRPCFTELCGRPSQSSLVAKLPSISPRKLYSNLPAVSHIPRAAKDDDAIAQPDAPADPFIQPEESPDFSNKNVDPDEKSFFHRREEYAMSMQHLTGQPIVPLVLLGPVDSGKSAFLKSIMEEDKSRVVYLNCGMTFVHNPELMAVALLDLAREFMSQSGMDFNKPPLNNHPFAKFLRPEAKLLALVCNALDATVPGREVYDAFMADSYPKVRTTNLHNVLKLYHWLLENIRPEGQEKPIIIIDEANVLKLWQAKDERSLKHLLGFFKRICKESHLAHVVFATSDYSLVSWLQSRGIAATQRRVEVLGYLTSAEAFVYVCGGKVRNKEGAEEEWPGLMAKSEEALALGMTREDWKKVWSVCGGNVFLLKNCVRYATNYKSWEKGTNEILSQPQKAVTKALEFPETILPPTGSSGPRIWEAKHYKAVLRLIADNPYHVVRRREVHAALEEVYIALEKVGVAENVSAAQMLLSMVEFNVLSLRPYSKMAKDIPREAFFNEVRGEEREDDVVTMPSPAHLAAVLELAVDFNDFY